MAVYKTKVTVIMSGKKYRPGDILPADISMVDLTFLKEKKFVELADVPAEVIYEDDGDEFDGFNEMKSEDEIRRIRTKKDLINYAASIKLDLGEWKDKSVKMLREEIINFQEEQIGEGGEGQDGEDGQKNEDSQDGEGGQKDEDSQDGEGSQKTREGEES